MHTYRISEDHIDRLSGIYLWTLHPNRKIRRVFQAYYQSEYRKIGKSLRDWIASANESITQLLDVFFDGVYVITFNKNGTVRYPSRLTF